MPTPRNLHAATNFCLFVTAVLLAACANSTKQMTSLPTEGSAQQPGGIPRAVVLFRIVTGGDTDGKPTVATLSTVPKWKWHYLVNAGPPNHSLDTGKAFGAGQFDAAARAAGWGFLTLPAGTYQLAFAAYRTRFTMPGAQRASLGFGQSGAFEFQVPAATSLLYVGTFEFTCRNADRWWGYVEHECTMAQVLDERELALQVATSSPGRFGPMQTGLAAAPSIEDAHQ